MSDLSDKPSYINYEQPPKISARWGIDKQKLNDFFWLYKESLTLKSPVADPNLLF